MRNLFIAGLLFISVYVYAEEVKPAPYMVYVTTTGVTAIDENLARKYIMHINTDADYTVWLSTEPISASTYVAAGAIPLGPVFGYYEDDFFVYKSTWYACTAEGSAYLSILEKEW